MIMKKNIIEYKEDWPKINLENLNNEKMNNKKKINC